VARELEGAAGILPWALVFLAIDELTRGRCAVAEAYASEGQRLALETGQPNIACQHLACLVMVAVLRGREQEARRLARQALAEATVHRLAWAASTTLALGTLALVTGHAEQALEQIETLWGAGPIPGHQRVALYCVPDLVEAACARASPHGRPSPAQGVPQGSV
jgi:ATP/maltotriose-dependent transcriptional regulator MalT